MSKSFGPYFQHNYDGDDRRTGYLRLHYDVAGYCNGSLTKDQIGRNVISRVRNNYVEAINAQVLLPKAVVIILEDDFMNAANHFTKGASHVLGPWIDWVANELSRLTAAYKEKLPTKSRKYRFPQFLWVPAVYHDHFGMYNIYREKFNACLRDVTEFKGMHLMKLSTWDRHRHLTLHQWSDECKRAKYVLGSGKRCIPSMGQRSDEKPTTAAKQE